MERDQATDYEIEKALEFLHAGLKKRMNKHGRGKFVSRAEALGILCEEYKETIDAMQGNVKEEFIDEMVDVAVTAIWAIVSLRKDIQSDLK